MRQKAAVCSAAGGFARLGRASVGVFGIIGNAGAGDAEKEAGCASPCASIAAPARGSSDGANDASPPPCFPSVASPGSRSQNKWDQSLLGRNSFRVMRSRPARLETHIWSSAPEASCRRAAPKRQRFPNSPGQGELVSPRGPGRCQPHLAFHPQNHCRSVLQHRDGLQTFGRHSS